MVAYFKLAFWALVFMALCLYMFFSLNMGMVIPILMVWYPITKNLDKIFERDGRAELNK